MLEQNVLALLSPYYWGPGPSYFLTYGFPSSQPDFGYSNDLTNGFIPLQSEQQNHVRRALEGELVGGVPTGSYMSLTSVASVTNLNPIFVGQSGAAMNIARTFSLNVSKAFYRDGTQLGGDVWFSADIDDPGNTYFHTWTTLHELGHALGLKHGHEIDFPNYTVMTPDRDSIEFSVMTYRTHVSDDGEFSDADAPSTFMMYDIAALQYLYGPNFSTNSTDTVYSWNSQGYTFVNNEQKGYSADGKIFMTIWDGGGTDTYDFSSYASNLKIDLAPGGWSVLDTAQLADLGDGIKARGSVFNALQYDNDPRSLIENAVGGTGNDQIFGNVASNRLQGGGGADTLNGQSGDDVLFGNSGNDTLMGGDGADEMHGGAGIDTIDYSDTGTAITVRMDLGKASGSRATGDTFDMIENVFAGWGNDTIYGDAGANTINGHFGNDTIYGGAGGDHLVGGEGNDLLVVTQDFAHLTGWGGQDTFKISPGTTGYIWDFEATFGLRDKLDVSGVFTSYADLWAHTSESGGDTIIAKGTTKIVFKETARHWLQQEDFIL